jgi:phosphoribosylglycinamide formyltransferase-1
MSTSEFRPPRIAVMTSHSAAGIEGLLADGHRGTLYHLVAVIGSDTSIVEQEIIDAAGVPTILRPLQHYFDERHLPIRRLHEREDYDAETADILRRLEIDYVILIGYHYIITEPLLAAFPQRIVALHDGDLTIRDEDGHRKYTGLHAVRDAILDGVEETRCSAYIVTREVGGGPLFLISGSYPLAAMATDARQWGSSELLTRYADIHRAWMQRSGWRSMLVRIMELICAGTIQVVGDVVWIDGVPGPCRLGDAPSVCHEREKTTASGVPATCPFISS